MPFTISLIGYIKKKAEKKDNHLACYYSPVSRSGNSI
jgi:hypothetical protein